jgi:hypothetical protein
MKPDEYEYLEQTLTGRRARDFEFESRMTFKAEGSIAKAALERERLNASKTHEEREIEQRQFSLRMYGRAHMLQYAQPIQYNKPLGELQVPGDQIISASPPQIKAHSGGEDKTWCDENGRLKLQFHQGEKGCFMQVGLK